VRFFEWISVTYRNAVYVVATKQIVQESHESHLWPKKRPSACLRNCHFSPQILKLKISYQSHFPETARQKQPKFKEYRQWTLKMVPFTGLALVGFFFAYLLRRQDKILPHHGLELPEMEG